MNKDKFIAIFAKEGITLTEKQWKQFELYSDLLVEWNEKFNLTAIIDKDEIYIKHFLDCLLLTKYNFNGNLCDIGSGAGFPGVVLKIFYPDLKVTLLEPNNKKITFLNEVINQLELKNIVAVNQRAEDFARNNSESFNFVTSRAVAALNILDELAIPLLKVNGHFIAAKGPKAYDELKESEKGINILGGKVNNVQEFTLGNDNKRIIIDIEKVKDTNKKYPRNFSQIKSKPL